MYIAGHCSHLLHLAAMCLALVALLWLSFAHAQRICNVLDYGAVPDGVTNNTAAFRKALTDCTQGSNATTQNQLLIPFVAVSKSAL